MRADPAELAGLIPSEVGEVLRHYASRATASIVEVGSYKGKSTAYLASATEQVVYAVDPWDLAGNVNGRFGFNEPSTYETFLAQTRDYLNIIPVKAFSQHAARTWPAIDIGLLYIDGDHSEVAVYNDVMAWRPHLTDDAPIILDDWGTPRNPGVRRAADRWAKILGPYQIEADRLAVWAP